MKRLPYDDTLTKLGDIYHYLMVVKLCFSLNEGEKIVVEQFGDISEVSETGSTQIEVKHHINESNFSDRSQEFWNTLKNWLVNNSQIKNFKHLVILTTSNIKKSSPFFRWDELDKDEKYTVLENIGAEKKENEKTFRGLFTKVFEHEAEEIKEVINKIVFVHSQPNVTSIKSEIKTKLYTVPEDKKDMFIDTLVGYIVNSPTEYPHSWEIEKERFLDFLVHLRDQFTGEGIWLPNKYQKIEINEYDNYLDKRFVNEIRRIEYEKQINSAINNVWKTNNTIIEYFEDNYIFSGELESYKIELKTKLGLLKDERALGCNGNDHKTRIKASKLFYVNSMNLPATNFGIVKNNLTFFQHGIIHEIVEEGKVEWFIEEDEVE